MKLVRVEALRPSELTTAHRAAWSRMAAANPALASPYHSLGYALAVGEARPDARVAVVEDAGAPVAFLGVQGRGRFAGLALGAPLSDKQALIAAAPAPRIDPLALCLALGVGRIDFTHVPAAHAGPLTRYEVAGHTWIAHVGEGKEAFLAGIRRRRAETLRQQDRKRRKLERERPETAFAANSKVQAHLDQLLEWKTDQCRRTGQPLVWAAPWVRRTVQASFESQDPAFRGVLFTLTDGETLVAAHYALVSGAAMHAWLIGHAHAYDAFSPGVLVTRFMVEWAADNGFAFIDFGAGDYRYKREFCEPGEAVGWGYIGEGSFASAVRGVEMAGRRLLERAPVQALAEAPGKVMRRLDVMRGLSAPGG